MAREMKDSGIKWIEEIPKDWFVSKIKYHCAMQSGDNLTSNDIEPEGDYAVYGANGFRGYYHRYNCEGTHILIGRQGALAGNVHIVDGKYWATDHAVVTKITDCTKDNYLYYSLISANLNQYAFVTAAQPGLAVSEIINKAIPIPPLSEQQAIADFLDAKCAEIDGLLADLDAEVKTLAEYKKSIIAETVTRGLNPNAPMKQSGIPWAETIPAHWNIQPVYKHFHDMIFLNLDYEYQRAFKFNYGTLKYKEEVGDLAFYKSTYIKYSKVKRGDIIINGLNLNYDFISQRVAITPEDGIITSAYLAIRPFDGVYSEFFCYLFKAMDNMKLFHGMGKGVRLTLSFDELKRVKLPIPSKDEQMAIVSFLDEKCAAIDHSITDKQTQIETLKSYKASLIYEYVTGKKQVI